MQITITFNDIYDGAEHLRSETFEVPVPTSDDAADDFDDWSIDHIFPQTGDGHAIDKDAIYFATVTDCCGYPSLVGTEFAWG